MQRSSSSLPPLASLRAFEAVSRLGSVKLASEYLNVTPSAISHQLRTLEAHFGIQLIQIKGRNIALTDEGAIYAPAIIRAFADLFRANELLDGALKDPLIHVSTTPTFAMLGALPYLEKFYAENPKLDLRLEARNADLDFDGDLFDAAVCIGTPPFQGMSAHRLFNSRLIPLAHPDLWEKFGPIRNAQDLARMPLIEFQGAPLLWRPWLSEIDPTLDHNKEEPYLISDSLLTAIQMAESGLGVILGPFPLIVSKVSAGILRPAAVKFPPPKSEVDFYFVCRNVVEHTSKIKAARKWLIEIANSLEIEAKKFGL